MTFLYIFLNFLRERYDRNVSDGASGRSMISIIYLMAALNFIIYLFAIFSDCQTIFVTLTLCGYKLAELAKFQ